MQQGMNPSLLNTTSPASSTSSQPIPFNPQFHDPIPSSNSSTTTTDEFLDHMLSSIPPCTWSDLSQPPPSLQDHTNNPNDDLNNTNNVFDESAILASKLMLQQHLLMASRACGVPQNESLLDGSSFNPPSQGGGEGLYNGFGGGSLPPTHSHQQFHPPQAQNFGSLGSAAVQPQASGSAGGGAVANQQQPKQRVRARRGQATDPHSIAERLRRERIAERMKSLQELVPNANKTDKASMLDEIIDYVKFLQLQVKVLSMSRLGGAAAVAPLVADMSSEGGSGVDCIQVGTNSGSLTHNGNQTASSSDNITVTEHQVAKLMEEDMGSAMQYLQGKGLCLMPISLATAISTATSHGRNPVIPNNNGNGHLLHQPNGEGPSSPNFSTLTVQSANVGNGVSDGSVKDAASVCKP